MEKDLDQEETKGIFNFKIILLLILGFILGMMIKNESIDKIAAGFDDYRIKSYEQGHDFDAISKKIEEQRDSEEMDIEEVDGN
ncbi:hypothetical protein ACFL08_03345 [Patescibacteria group bacterium]